MRGYPQKLINSSRSENKLNKYLIMLSVFIETRESQARLSSNTRYRTFPGFQRPRASIMLPSGQKDVDTTLKRRQTSVETTL